MGLDAEPAGFNRANAFAVCSYCERMLHAGPFDVTLDGLMPMQGDLDPHIFYSKVSTGTCGGAIPIVRLVDSYGGTINKAV
jgi:hypothetical protein